MVRFQIRVSIWMNNHFFSFENGIFHYILLKFSIFNNGYSQFIIVAIIFKIEIKIIKKMFFLNIFFIIVLNIYFFFSKWNTIITAFFTCSFAFNESNNNECSRFLPYHTVTERCDDYYSTTNSVYFLNAIFQLEIVYRLQLYQFWYI